MSPATTDSASASGAGAERRRHLLDTRSAALARRGLDGRRDEAARQTFLVCACGTERYGLPLAALAGVLPDRPCTAVPGAPAALRGIIAHAGAIVSVIDLGQALGVRGDASVGEDEGHPGHLVRLRAQEPPIALAVDRVLGLADVAPDRLAPAPGSEHGPSGSAGLGIAAVSGYFPADAEVSGSASGGFSVIDLPRLLRPFLP